MILFLRHPLRACAFAIPALLQVACWDETACGEPPANEEKIYDDDAVLRLDATPEELRGAVLQGTFLVGETETTQQRIVEALSIAVIPSSATDSFVCNQKRGLRYLMGCMSTSSHDGINVQVHAHQGQMSRFELALVRDQKKEVLYRGLLSASKTGGQVCGTFDDAELQR